MSPTSLVAPRSGCADCESPSAALSRGEPDIALDAWVAEQQWKGRSSKAIQGFLFRQVPGYASKFPQTDPIWQVRFYSFEIYTTAKIEEKLNYMHLNPVRTGLVETPTQWR